MAVTITKPFQTRGQRCPLFRRCSTFWRRLRRSFGGIFNREKTTLHRQILSARGKTQPGLRLRSLLILSDWLQAARRPVEFEERLWPICEPTFQRPAWKTSYFAPPEITSQGTQYRLLQGCSAGRASGCVTKKWCRTWSRVKTCSLLPPHCASRISSTIISRMTALP
jgi:hypothetical protein